MLVTEYYRNLPHWQHVGATFFITFNLRGAIPREVYERLAEEKQLSLTAIGRFGSSTDQLYNEHKRHFTRVDRVLDTCRHGPDWLGRADIADAIKTKIHQYDGAMYDLLACCVMSNHVHIVVDSAVQLDVLGPNDTITSANYTQLHTALKYIKGGSARLGNQLLGRNGAFWQPESYDHYVRNAPELGRIIDYTLQNPVKAGLVESWQDWPHSYLSERFR